MNRSDSNEPPRTPDMSSAQFEALFKSMKLSSSPPSIKRSNRPGCFYKRDFPIKKSPSPHGVFSEATKDKDEYRRPVRLDSSYEYCKAADPLTLPAKPIQRHFSTTCTIVLRVYKSSTDKLNKTIDHQTDQQDKEYIVLKKSTSSVRSCIDQLPVNFNF